MAWHLATHTHPPLLQMGCEMCGPELQAEVAFCLGNVMREVFAGGHRLKQADSDLMMVMTAIAVSADRIDTERGASLDVKEASELPMAKLIPFLVDRTKKMINCDRASIFVYDVMTEELTTILADSTDQISIPADSNSIAGECFIHGNIINLRSAYDHPNFNREIDRRTGYRTRSMLVRRRTPTPAPPAGPNARCKRRHASTLSCAVKATVPIRPSPRRCDPTSPRALC